MGAISVSLRHAQPSDWWDLGWIERIVIVAQIITLINQKRIFSFCKKSNVNLLYEKKKSFTNNRIRRGVHHEREREREMLHTWSKPQTPCVNSRHAYKVWSRDKDHCLVLEVISFDNKTITLLMWNFCEGLDFVLCIALTCSLAHNLNFVVTTKLSSIYLDECISCSSLYMCIYSDITHF